MTEGYAVTEDGIRIHYRVIGEGSETLIAPPKCVLEEDLGPLASGRRLVLYDPRSRGGSDAVAADKVGVELELADIEAVRRHLSLDSFSLMGWSYLSLVAALYAARYPERITRLVMVGVMPVRKLDHPDIAKARQEKFDARFDTAAAEQVRELRAAGIDTSDPERFTRAYWRVMWPTNMVEPGIMDRQRSDPFRYANEHPDHVSEHSKTLFDLGNWDYRPQARQVLCPTLIVQGVEDLGPMQGAEEWAAHLRDARLLRVEGAAHWPWLEAPDVFFPAVEQFLAGTWPAAVVEVAR